MKALRDRVSAVVTFGALWAGGVAHAEPAQWYFQAGALSHHFQQTQAPGREWNDTHAGLGLERREIADIEDDSWCQARWAGGLMRDSRNFWGGYAGAACVRSWRVGGAVEAGIGLGAFGLYRSVSWNGTRKLVPALLPTASVGSADGTMGMNLLFVPRVGLPNGSSTPATLLGQFVFRFK